MKRPLLTTSTDFHEALSAHYGMYGRLTHPRVEDILQRAIDIGALYNIFHGKVHVDVERVTHQDNVIQIPEQNLQGAATVYLVDSATWIMFLQSNVDRSEAYAWQIPVMDYYPAYPTTYRITPVNPTLYQEGWHIDADAKGALGSYIRNHTDQLITISRNSKLAEPPKFQVTQRLATATYQQYQLPQIDTKNVIDEFMKFWETN